MPLPNASLDNDQKTPSAIACRIRNRGTLRKKRMKKSNKGNKEPAYHLILILHLALYGGLEVFELQDWHHHYHHFGKWKQTAGKTKTESLTGHVWRQAFVYANAGKNIVMMHIFFVIYFFFFQGQQRSLTLVWWASESVFLMWNKAAGVTTTKGWQWTLEWWGCYNIFWALPGLGWCQ